jgi:hypothetical protein
MAVISAPAAAWAVAAPTAWTGPTTNEQDGDVVNGNQFDNARGTLLQCRNTTAGAINITFYADLLGTEVLVGTVSIPGSGTQNGHKIIGPFPSDAFNNHSTSVPASDGRVLCKQASGSNGQIKFFPFVVNLGLCR